MDTGKDSRLRTHHDARYPFLWVQTTEEERIIRENRAQIDEDVSFFSWDICNDFREFRKCNGSGWQWVPMEMTGTGVAGGTQPGMPAGMAGMKPQPDPRRAFQIIQTLPENSIIFMKDYHKFFTDIRVLRQALSAKDYLKSMGQTIIFLSAGMDIPMEIKNDITVVDFPYPDRRTLETILEKVAEDNGITVNGGHDEIIDALMGFTWEGAENALCLSLVAKGGFDVRMILDTKAAYLSSTGYLKYGNFSEKLEDLYGLEYMKRFVLDTINTPKSRGILIYGVPGTGKSCFSKAIGNAVGRAVLIGNLSGLRGRYQGDAETRVADLFKTVEAFGRPICYVDELDKAVAGSGASETDGGVGQRILGEFLTYMEDKPRGGSYWICTCNSLDDVMHLSGGALMRRFDAIFFVDMPTQEEARGIAKIWGKKEGVEIPDTFDFTGYTGADIAKLATQMSMFSMSRGEKVSAEEAARFVIPYGKANGEELERIREKARGVCIWATQQEKGNEKGDNENVVPMGRKVKMGGR